MIIIWIKSFVYNNNMHRRIRVDSNNIDQIK